MGPIVAIILLLVFGLYILNLLVKFVSLCLEGNFYKLQIKLQMPLIEMKMTYYLSPLDNTSLGHPDAEGPFIALLSAGSSQ
jgi:hypothetical protein